MDQRQEKNQEFLLAVSNNDHLSIAALFKDNFYPDFEDIFKAICDVAQKGYLETADLLIGHKEYTPKTLSGAALELAWQNGHMEIVQLLLFKKKPDRYTKTLMSFKNYSPTHPFLWAVRQGLIQIVTWYLDKDWRDVNEMNNGTGVRYSSYFHANDYGIFQQGYHEAIRLENLQIVAALLNDDRVSPDMRDNPDSPLVIAIQTGNLALVNLLLEDGALNASDHKNAAFNKACELGHLDIIKLLIEKYHVLPYHEKITLGKFYNDSPQEGFQEKTFEGLHKALTHKRTLVLEYLLQLPNMPLETIFLKSAVNNLLGLILLLLPRINPGFKKSLTLRTAASNGHHEIVACLLQEGSSQPEVYDNQALREAANGGHVKVVKLLLDDPRVNPGARDNNVLYDAALYKRVPILKMLIAHPKVDWGARENTILGLIFKNNLVEILKELSFQQFIHAMNKADSSEEHKTSLKNSRLLMNYSLFKRMEPALPNELIQHISSLMMAPS